MRWLGVITVVLGLVSAAGLYRGAAIGMLECGPGDERELCRENYALTALAEAGCALTVVSGIIIAAHALRSRRKPGPP